MKNDKDRYWDCLDQAMEASHSGRTEEALAWLDEALRVHPDGAEARNGRGEILWDEGRVDEALFEFECATAADPKFTAAHLNRVELLIEELSEFELALERCDELLSGRPELPRPDRSLQSEVYYLKSKSLFYLDDLEGAVFLVRRALKAAGDQPIYSALEGQILFELGRYEEAHRVLEHAVALDPDSAHCVYHYGLVLERSGDPEEAARCFARANAIDASHYPLPAEVSEEFFREVMEEALGNLPRSVRDTMENVPVIVEDFPSVDLIQTEDVSPQILGIFIGTPRTQAVLTNQVPDLDRIILFQKNLEKICQDREDLIDQIQVTLRHEVGHYLGLDEDDLERLGLA
jgi:predicted Zn-dependent protease with MMP-like domain/Flp pilus assembly protein TadD